MWSSLLDFQDEMSFNLSNNDPNHDHIFTSLEMYMLNALKFQIQKEKTQAGISSQLYNKGS